MNIFVSGGGAQSGLTGLPGNNANAVLHNSFLSGKVSTGEKSLGETSSTQSPAVPRQAVETQIPTRRLGSALTPNLSSQTGIPHRIPRHYQPYGREAVYRGAATILKSAANLKIHPNGYVEILPGPPPQFGFSPPPAQILAHTSGQQQIPQQSSAHQPLLHPRLLYPSQRNCSEPLRTRLLPAAHRHITGPQQGIDPPGFRQSAHQHPLGPQNPPHFQSVPHQSDQYQPLATHQPLTHQTHSHQVPAHQISVPQPSLQQSLLPQRPLPSPAAQQPAVHQWLQYQPVTRQPADYRWVVQQNQEDQRQQQVHQHAQRLQTLHQRPVQSPIQQLAGQQHPVPHPVQHKREIQQKAVLRSVKLQPVIEERAREKSEAKQPAVSKQPALQQPFYKTRVTKSIAKRPQAKQETTEQPPTGQQKPEQHKRESNKLPPGTGKPSVSRQISEMKRAPEKLIDYGLCQNFDSTSPDISDRLIHGAIIHPRPNLSVNAPEKNKPLDKGKDTEVKHEEKMAPKANTSRTDPPRTDAPRSLGGTGEEITKEEAVLNAKAQMSMDMDEARLKLETMLNKAHTMLHPTAEDAAKARQGKLTEDLAAKMNITIKQLEKNERKLDEAEKERSSISEKELAATGVSVDDDALMKSDEATLKSTVVVLGNKTVKQTAPTHDFMEGLSNYPEILMEIAKYVEPKDLVKLYSMSKPFHEIISSYLSHTMRLAAKTQAPESASVFRFKFYGELCTLDPIARPHPHKLNEVRMVPSLRWLQMVVHRDKTVRDILALMARQGHRMPSDMSLSLKKMWLVMDVSTCRQRVQLMNSPYYTDKDIFNMQMFFVKLDMRFNSPYDGPGNDQLRRLMLGQRGLTPLRHLLKRKIGLTEIELSKMGARYMYNFDPMYRGMPFFDIPPEEIGIGHLEGWGKGHVHLYRPDQLVIRESVRRRLDLKSHIMGMLIWGYIDPRTGKNIEVSDEEKYMSESDTEGEEYLAWNDEWDPDSEWETDNEEEVTEHGK